MIYSYRLINKLICFSMMLTCLWCTNSYSAGIRSYDHWTVTLIHDHCILLLDFFPLGAPAPSGSDPPHYRGFTITLWHTALGRTRLDEWSARRRDVYQATHNTHKRQTSMSPAGFETTIPTSERPQTHAVRRAVTVFRLRLDCIT